MVYRKSTLVFFFCIIILTGCTIVPLTNRIRPRGFKPKEKIPVTVAIVLPPEAERQKQMLKVMDAKIILYPGLLNIIRDSISEVVEEVVILDDTDVNHDASNIDYYAFPSCYSTDGESVTLALKIVPKEFEGTVFRIEETSKINKPRSGARTCLYCLSVPTIVLFPLAMQDDSHQTAIVVEEVIVEEMKETRKKLLFLLKPEKRPQQKYEPEHNGLII